MEAETVFTLSEGPGKGWDRWGLPDRGGTVLEQRPWSREAPEQRDPGWSREALEKRGPAERSPSGVVLRAWSQ